MLLEKARTRSLKGKAIGGFWRMKGGTIEIKRFGTEWSRVPLHQIQRCPNLMLLWQGEVMVLSKD